ncbi:Arm DNA-binding domain-containing protein [Bartonella sp. HY329]|nr:Arm DNA-binding domain-containing protein [Bartonella sp. HY329]UXM96040.1 Arm DNA-binding domain-containing protein [Bartonella sp. HY329]
MQFGRYDNENGISLVEAREMLADARKLIEQGRSPAK